MNKIPIPEIHLSLPKIIRSEDIENGSFNKTGKYSYFGPGIKLSKRSAQGYKGINDLDKACLEHDIAYDSNIDTKNIEFRKLRNLNDNVLAQEANRLANDTSKPEYFRNDSKRVAALMSAKSWMGMGNKWLSQIYFDPK